MTKSRLSLMLAGFIFMLMACKTIPLFQRPTPTPTPTETPAPTETPLPTQTPTPKPDVEFSTHRTAEGGGFSYYRVKEWIVEDEHGDVYFINPDLDLFIRVLVRYHPDLPELEEDVEYMMTSLGEDLDNSEVYGPFPYVVDGYEGLAFDYSGETKKGKLAGRSILIYYAPNHVLFSDIYSYENPDDGTIYLEEKGYEMAEKILAKIELHEVTIGRKSTDCVVSKDKEYGYSEDNPIYIGGGALMGYARTQAYFESLMGLKGQVIRTSWEDTIEYGGSYLDVYEVWYSGLDESVTLYVNENRWKGVEAPTGFKCMKSFPFGEP